jgi:hypothetical protein
MISILWFISNPCRWYSVVYRFYIACLVILFLTCLCVTEQYFHFLMHNYFFISLYADVVVTFCTVFFNMWYRKSTLGLGCLIVEVSGSHIVRYTHQVGLLRMSDQLIAETGTYQHTTNTEINIHAVSRIQTYDSNSWEAEDLCFRPHSHQDCHAVINNLNNLDV